jgi:MoaA/NifB/PqqE/SkfB family radical SAM enzyme
MAKIGYIQIIRKCNQKCIICSNPDNDNVLDFEEAEKEIDKLKLSGYGEVILTGGEPTLHERLPELIRYASGKKISPRIVTNGQKLAELKYLKKLKKAGLTHLHLSVYSHKDAIQSKLSQNKESLKNIKKALDNLGRLGGIAVDVNTAINKYNCDHLSETATWIVKNYPFVKHFVFNNLDPYMNRVASNPEVVPSLNDLELELHRTLSYLSRNGRTFRVERVPLCYLGGFEYVSTETRKIVKGEGRAVYFLDSRGEIVQNDWIYKKAASCQRCALTGICAGLYTAGGYYKESELAPVFIAAEKIIKKIK